MARHSKQVETFVLVWVILTLLVQRIAVGHAGGQVFAVVPLGLGVLFVGFAAGMVSLAPMRTLFVCLLAAALAVAALAGSLILDNTEGVYAYLFLCSILLPLTLVRTGDRASGAPLLLYRGFISFMAAAAVMGVLQILVQVVGGGFLDPLAWLPDELLADGFVYTYPIEHGSLFLKSNGGVFLEASFYSQFLAVAILLGVEFGASRWLLGILVAGLLVSFSGTGIILLVVGLGAQAVFLRRWKWIGVMILVAIGVSVSPAGEVFAERNRQQGQRGSSSELRFSLPYSEFLTEMSVRDAAVLVTGRGPGSTDGLFVAEEDTQQPAPVKFVLEYGVFVGLVLVLVVTSIVVGRPPVPLGASLVVQLLVLQNSFLNPAVIFVIYGLSGLWYPIAAPSWPGTRGSGNSGSLKLETASWRQFANPRI